MPPASIILCRANVGRLSPNAIAVTRNCGRKTPQQRSSSVCRYSRFHAISAVFLLILVSPSPSPVSSRSVPLRKTPSVTRKKPLLDPSERIPSGFLYFVLRLSCLLFTYPRVRATRRRKSQNSMRDWLARAIVRSPPIVLETLPRKEI